MLSRREFLASAAAGAALARWEGLAVAAAAWTTDFATLPPGPGWPGFACVGVANLRRESGEGVLEAGSDVFPNDPRPVAFGVDRRHRDGTISAVFSRTGAGAGVVLRRTSPREYYAAVYDQVGAALVILRRSGDELTERARVPALPVRLPITLKLEASGAAPTTLAASLVDADGLTYDTSVADGHGPLQSPGDPGLLATARTLFPSEPNTLFPALGNLHLLPYGVQEGQVVIESPAGQAVIGAIRERSTIRVRSVSVTASEAFGPTTPCVVAATTGAPRENGATLHVATDLPARVDLEVSERPDFADARRLGSSATGDHNAVAGAVAGLDGGERAYWRAVATRGGHSSTGPARSFRTLPAAGDRSAVSLAIAACASQFGPIFDQLSARRPDVYVWQGDLNYPDTHGPLAQTASGYAGIWRDFLANPRTRALLESTAFVACRDDHDYGVQDAHAGNLKAFGLGPWEALMEAAPYHRFGAGLAEVWVLDQRRFKSPPDAHDTEAKTLLGLPQREWLFTGLAASRAPFKVICSPCTLSPTTAENTRDGNWSSGYTAERDLLLRHLERAVSGRTIFVSGDTHYTMVYDRGSLFEARPCPLDIPTPNDVTLVDPLAAQQLRRQPGIVYAEDRHGHFAFLEVSGTGNTGLLELTLVRQDGVAAYTKRFEEPIGSAGAPRDEGGAPDPRPRRPATRTPRAAARAGRALPFTGIDVRPIAAAGLFAATAGAVLRRLSERRRR